MDNLFLAEDLIINSYSSINTKPICIGIPKGIEILHKPTGIKVCCDKFRKQEMNRNWCFMKLNELLTPKKTQTCPHCGWVMGHLDGVDFLFCHSCTKKFEVLK